MGHAGVVPVGHPAGRGGGRPVQSKPPFGWIPDALECRYAQQRMETTVATTGVVVDGEPQGAVVVSARASLRDREKAIELGADAFVPKPFNVDDLLEVVHRLER